MKSIFFCILIFLIIGIVFISGCVTQDSFDKSADLDLQTFQEFDKSHFGFMHPEGAYYFMKELDVHWARPHPGPFIWGNIEKVKDSYDWSETDAYMKRSQAYDVAILATIWPYVEWDQKQCHDKLSSSAKNFFPQLGEYRGKPCDMEQYKEFIKKMVERYDGDGKDDMPNLKYPIKYWEIINEVELSPMDSDFPPFFNAETEHDYLDVLKTSYNAIKEADPEAKVLVGGIAGEFRGMSKEEWSSFIKNGGRNYIDIFNIHTDMHPENLHLESVRDFMEKNDVDLPVWITELQFGTSKSDFISEPHDFMVDATEEEVAQHLVKIFVQAFAANVTRIFYVGLDESPGLEQSWLINCSDKEKEDMTSKLQEKEASNETCAIQKAYYAFKTMVDKIDFFTDLETLFISNKPESEQTTQSRKYCGDGICDGPETEENCPQDCKDTVVSETIESGEAYKFIVNGKPVYVVWGQKLPEEITGQVKITDVFGNEISKDASEIELTEEPIFIELNKKSGKETETEQQSQQSGACPPEFVDTKSPHPDIKDITETWKFDSEVIETESLKEDGVHKGFVAPEVIKMGDLYRMFLGANIERGLNLPQEQRTRESGIASFVSNDLESWTFEGIVVESGPEGSGDESASHPWIMELGNGYRMFYQGAKPEDGKMSFSIWSAVSPDGKKWEKEGLVIGESDWLFDAAHGRAQKLNEDNYIMVFSANVNQCEPSSVMVARSTDGKNWDIQREPLAYYGHDPTIMYENGRLRIYYKYLDKKFFYVESTDGGKTFSEPKLVVFLDESGKNTLENPEIEGEGFPADIDYDGEKYIWAQNDPKEKMMFTRFVMEK